MQTGVWFAIAGVVIVLLLVAGWMTLSLRQRRRLRERFGPEYDRAVQRADSQRAAVAQLRERAARVADLDLRPLQDDERSRFLGTLRAAQLRFVDDPEGAAEACERLVAEVMAARGFRDEGSQRRADDLSAAHPQVAEDYRRAHATVRDGGGTEAHRQAVLALRRVFHELAGVRDDAATPPARP